MNLLIADSGSTKTDWALLSDGDVVRQWQTSGINPVMQTTNSIIATLQSDYSHWSDFDVDKVRFYGAGCMGGESSLTVRQALFSICKGNPHIEVASDLLGAACALFGSEPGVACVLGTGSNSGFFDGSVITCNVPPLGYILGDEGSGAYIGKCVVSNCLKGLTSVALTEKLYSWSGLTYYQFIESVYRKPFANRFLARFTQFAKENIDSEEIQQIIESAFETFVQRNLLQYEGVENVNIGFVGGVAVAFEEQLRKVLKRHFSNDIVIMSSPIEGLIRHAK